MRNISHSANTHNLTRSRWKERDAVSSKRHGESCDDIRIACHLWLLRRCPGYAQEHATLVDMAARNFTRA
jgi:hypothetical protein